MSEKRFWFVIDNGKLEYVQDNVTGEKITVTELEDLLNELSDENEKLRFLIDINSVSERKKLERQVDEQQDTIRKLRNENIILKNKIEDLRVSLFMQDQVLQRQMQKSDLDE